MKKAIKKASTATPAPRQLYKVLVDGKSFHGGNHTWSLPHDGKPGDWHEVPSTELCKRGFHLTTEPAQWWGNGAKVWAVEAEDLGDERVAKIVARRVRVLREVTDEAELRALRIVVSGEHEVRDGVWVASGSSTVTAYDFSTVRASGSSTVTAYDSSTVTAYDFSTVTTPLHYGLTTSARVAELNDRSVHVDQRGAAPVVKIAGQVTP